MSQLGASADDWDQHWEQLSDSGEMNPAQGYRRRLIVSLLGVKAAAPRILDIGSGQGDLAALIRRRYPGASIVGLELSRSGCEVSRRKVPDARFLQWNLLEAKPPPEELCGWATNAICSEVLEHVDEPWELLSNAKSFLAPGCRLVVTVPGGPMSAFDRHIGHRQHYSRLALRQLLERSGFQVDGVLGAGFPFHNLYRLAVIARGERLIKDASAESNTAASLPARLLAGAFDVLFRLNLPSSRFGWQMIAVARVPQ
ncbi:MAG: class I SAM-dependent methyltransferase [Actinomycetota bacterium]